MEISTTTRFGWGFSRDWGGSNQSQITESKIYRQTPIILYNVNMAQQDSKKSKVQLP
jgi:hypothetical protein